MQAVDQVVAITGASGGIGAATSRLLAAQGNQVVLAARREAELAQIAEEIAAAGGQASTCVTDVTRREDLDALVEHATARFGRLDALVSNAGIATTGPLLEGDPSSWDAMIDVNLRGVLNGVAAALPVFSSQGRGHLVTVTSTAAIAMEPEAVAQAIAWALVQPPEIDVGEIVVRSAAQP